jgi:hypothetical protein
MNIPESVRKTGSVVAVVGGLGLAYATPDIIANHFESRGPNSCLIYRGPVQGGLLFEDPETGEMDTVRTYPIGEGSPLQDLRMGNTYNTEAISESCLRWVQRCDPDGN